jgi:hypothetical protein
VVEVLVEAQHHPELMVVLVVEVELILITQEEQELQTKGSLVGQPTALMVGVVEELLR